jgi:hypothetical protein
VERARTQVEVTASREVRPLLDRRAGRQRSCLVAPESVIFREHRSPSFRNAEPLQRIFLHFIRPRLRRGATRPRQALVNLVRRRDSPLASEARPVHVDTDPRDAHGRLVLHRGGTLVRREGGDSERSEESELPGALHALHIQDSELDGGEWAAGERLLTIRAADSAGQRSSASILLNRMYAWRNYGSVDLPVGADRMTFVASVGHSTVGTITIGFDSSEGLFVDELFRREVDEYRAVDQRVCEFVKLAVDKMITSKRLLAALFHTAFIYARDVKACEIIVIEVNPRHVRFYERMLGFEVIGSSRLKHRVNAPAVLLGLDLEYVHRRITEAGQLDFEAPSTGRSLYAYSFSAEEEAGISARMKNAVGGRPGISPRTAAAR